MTNIPAEQTGARTQDQAPPRLILASGSPQRRRLLTAAGYDFEIVPPHATAECGICSSGGPAELVGELAVSKALNVVSQLKGRKGHEPGSDVILACDTVAECQGEVLGKPRDETHARAMLELLRGRVHRVFSGVCLWRPADSSAAPDVRVAVSELRMDKISDEAIDEYLDSRLWRDKAGAFGYQDRIGWLHITSGGESNVIGLPMELVTAMLETHAIYPVKR